jgi:hypothetical protein
MLKLKGKIPGIRLPRSAHWRDGVERKVCHACNEVTIIHTRRYLGVINGEHSWAIIQRETGVVDHIIPERIIRRFCSHADPHDPRNLVSVCVKCHGKKLRAERMLHAGNVLGFLQEVNRLGYDANAVNRAMHLYFWCKK